MMLRYSLGKACEETKGETIQKDFQSSVISLLFYYKNGGWYKYIYIAIEIKPAKSYKGNASNLMQIVNPS